ncbi:DUF6138 family protein [uncultured Acinetobacter sp.]|uniref:DUF6138 family protein n=1 Tax=uncultured Acinetobacter sp. TaxID=165433 RepID=UPI00258B647B|nr:DUF6138 family protein [uncultured Acinetobacter sp.]
MPLDNSQEILIDDILNGHFELVKEYPNNPASKLIRGIYLPKHELELKVYKDLKELISYFFTNHPFDFHLYLNFFKQLNIIYSKTYNGFESCTNIFVKEVILPKYFYADDPKHWSPKFIKKTNLTLELEDQDILKIFMYGVRCMAYTQSPNYSFQNYLNYINELDTNLYHELVSKNNAELEIEVITTENSYFKAISNNLLASIEIQAFTHNEETYKAILNYINQLFANGFPQSHKLKFELKEIEDQRVLDIPSLPNYGANRLFNSAAKYHNLHPDIETYINLVEKGNGFYTDLKEAEYVEIEGFAIFSLVIENAKYADKFIKFLDKTDNHNCLQNHIPSAFLDRQGIASQTIKTYLKLCAALLEQENFGLESNHLYSYFNNVEAMKILVQEVNIYRQEQHNIQWFEIFWSLISYGDHEDLFNEVYAMKKFKSREIWEMYLMIEEELQ